MRPRTGADVGIALPPGVGGDATTMRQLTEARDALKALLAV